MILELTNIIAIGYGMYSIVKFKLPTSIKNAYDSFFNCPKCFAFWMVLISYQDIQSALLCSLVAFLLDSFVVTKL
jgi:hypothetical protein